VSRVCTVCRHAERGAIDEALVGGTPFRNVAERHSLSVASLFRHRKEHIAAALVKVEAVRQEAEGLSLFGKVKALEVDAHRLKRLAEEDHDYRAALVAVDKLLGVVKLMHELSTPAISQAAVRAQAVRMAERHGITVEALLERAEQIAAELAGEPVKKRDS